MEKNTMDGVIIGENKGDIRLGDDIHHNNYSYTERKNKAQFELLSAHSDLFRNYSAPRFINEIEQRIKNYRLLLVGGNVAFDKGRFLKYIAVQSKNEGQEIKECTNFHNFYGLSSAMHEETQSCVFIINRVTAKDLGYGFKELKNIAKTRNHVILVSTEDTYDSWHFTENVQQSYWFEVPEENLYARETLLGYLDEISTKNHVPIPYKKELVVSKLSSIEQLDGFMEYLLAHKDKIDESVVLEAIRINTSVDSSNIEQWYHSLNSQNKLIVIGMAIFDGAYESQFFAGMERILSNTWKNRNNELKSIDYEDLIPLMSFFKIEGKTIRSKFRNQRRKIIQLGWRTHKRYIMSAIPVLVDIVLESSTGDFTDWDLFPNENYQSKIRDVISETFSDIGLQSFEEIQNAFLQLAAHQSRLSQIVVAKAISRWEPIDKEKIYQVLERWQINTEIHRMMQSYIQTNGESASVPLSYIQGTVALTLLYTSQYEPGGNLSAKIKDLLLGFLENNNPLVVNRMQYALEGITTKHPESMADILLEKFLLFGKFVGPAAIGLANAYNSGYSVIVKQILQDWMKHCNETVQEIEDYYAFTHRDKILSAIILTLRYIDYSFKSKEITIRDAYEILENYRKNIHNNVVRELLLVTIVDLIEVNFYSNENISIDLISNIDEKEREYVVNEFLKKYLYQRTKLTGGNYTISLDGHKFESWTNQEERPETHIEKLLGKWKKSELNILSQIAFKSFYEFDKIETREKKLIEEYNEERKKQEEEKQKEQKTIELPKHEGDLKLTEESKTFVKVCTPFVSTNQTQMLQSIAIMILQNQISQESAEKLIVRIDDEKDKNSRTVRSIVFIHALFRNGRFNLNDSPLPGDFKSSSFVGMTYFLASSSKKDLLRGFAPILMNTDLTSRDVDIITSKINENNSLIKFIYILCKRPLIIIILLIIILYVFFKILSL